MWQIYDYWMKINGQNFKKKSPGNFLTITRDRFQSEFNGHKIVSLYNCLAMVKIMTNVANMTTLI
jgi:hypothetical protein